MTIIPESVGASNKNGPDCAFGPIRSILLRGRIPIARRSRRLAISYHNQFLHFRSRYLSVEVTSPNSNKRGKKSIFDEAKGELNELCEACQFIIYVIEDEDHYF